MAAGPPGRPRPPRRPGRARPAAAGWLACIRAISAGSLVQRKCSAGEARAWNDTRADGPAASSPSPRRAASSSCRSPADSRNSLGDLADGLGGLAEQDLGGGVRDHGPAQVGGQHVLRVLGDRREPGPRLAGGLRQPEQEPRALGVAHQQPRLVHGDQPPPAPGGVGDRPPGGVQGEQGRGRAQLVGDVAEAEDDQVPLGAGGGRGGEQAGVGALGERDEPVGQRRGGRRLRGAQRGREGGQQRGGPRPRPGVGGDPGLLVGGHDRLVQRRPLGRGRLAAAQHRDDGVEEQGTAGQGVRPGPPGGGQVERVQVHARRAQVDVRAAYRGGQPGVLVLGVDHPALGALVQADRRISSLAR